MIVPKGCHIVGVLLGLLLAFPLGAHAQQKPNIVIFLSDDHGQEDAGCYGNEVVPTPVIDQLAREGMVFTRAYTPVSVCAPSRSALFTGLYPHRNGCDRNHGSVHPDIRSLPHYFSAAGYEVILAGKVHVKPEAAFPFVYMERHEVPGYLSRRHEQPFCLVVSLNAPHQPYFNLKGGHGNVAAKRWMPQTPETAQYTAAYYDHVALADQEIGSILYWLEHYGFGKNSIQLYLSDHGPAFPFAKWTLYEQGIRIPLIVKWPGVVAPGTTSDALVSMVDILPTLMEMAGAGFPDTLDGRSIVPILKQQEVAVNDNVYGCYTNLGVQGANEYPIRTIVGRRHKLIVNLRQGNRFSLKAMDEPDERAIIDARMVLDSWVLSGDAGVARANNYRYRPALELYDLLEDPYELTNLADDKKLRETIVTMYRALAVWMEEQQDPFSNEMRATETDLFTK
ncbi:sulfatase family protein [Parapedobacter soli]|uniref:sulfatase family protein n=1 Tax=Parapedobacter soli TaxID=416955 RepID=UPI0021C9C758|nr:sulfatase [Parapedobacter soli]